MLHMRGYPTCALVGPLTFVRATILAPAATSTLTMSADPNKQTSCSAVCPPATSSVDAPAAMSAAIQAPAAAARSKAGPAAATAAAEVAAEMSGVRPRLLRALGAAPPRNSAQTTSL